MNKDLEDLQGTWTIVALEVDGSRMPAAALGGAQIVVAGNTFATTSMGAIHRGELTVDAAQQPRHLDLRFTAGPEAGNTNFGIYEVDGDSWQLCLDTTGRGRPKAFATRPGSGLALEQLRRAPAAAGSQTAKSKTQSTAARTKSKAKRADAEPTRAKGARAASGQPSPGVTAFEGEWTMVAGVIDGNPMDKSMVTWARRVTRGDETSVFAGPQLLFRFRFTHDPARSPQTIDYVNLAGPDQGKAQQGIYEFERGTLKLCVAAPGKERPLEFASTRGDGRMFTVWKKAKKA